MKKTSRRDFLKQSALSTIGIGVTPYLVPVLQAEENLPKNNVRELRVLSYNIHIGIGMDEKLDLERTAKTILKQNPDIAALQEVDRMADRTQKIDQVKELAKLTGMEAVFGKTVDRSNGEYGIAILTKHPILEQKYNQLPRLGNREDRGALSVKIRLDDKTKLLFICTHFCHQSEERRTMQAQKINELFAADNDLPTILAGDFNAQPDSVTIATLKEKWFDTTDTTPTFGNPQPSIKLDYIFCRPESLFKVKQTNVIEDAVTSDHCPVLSVMELITP
ncbi:MAG: endonuclease/exonuclease/phosphatase family protein [Planctomycetaceae bacterium]|jgi:endonuclease/exonuclease/phosphatase family metal-dependent hydrolase|nr:endonuclease/exonuclease/phosphatase family protein [Planctomycetaceae bacterium]